MSPSTKRKLKRFAILLLVIALTVRGFAWYSAWRFGRNITNMMMYVGRIGFADTDGLRARLAESDLHGHLQRVRAVSFFGKDYEKRMMELEAGLIYLSEQAGLPPRERFATLPPLKYLKLEVADPSDEGMSQMLVVLLTSYSRSLW